MQRSRPHAHHISRSISGWLGTGLMGSTLLMISPAVAANTLSAWQFDPDTRQFTVTLPQGVAPRFLVAAEPARIILEIPQTRLGQVEAERSYDGAVRSVRLSETDNDTLQVVLELAPGTVLDPNHAQLTSMTAADQTRWVLTPLIAEAGTVATTSPAETRQSNTDELPQLPSVALETTAGPENGGAAETAENVVAVPSLPLDSVDSGNDLSPPPEMETIPAQAETATAPPDPEMVVELPVIPAAESGFEFSEEGQGRLSTHAANLMLSADIDSVDNLPETLPIDPFDINMAEAESVTVPGLDELDATVGSVATVPTEPTPDSAASIALSEQPPTTANEADSTAPEAPSIATTPPGEDTPATAVEAEVTASSVPSDTTANPANPPAITVAPPVDAAATENDPDENGETTVATNPSTTAQPAEQQTLAGPQATAPAAAAAAANVPEVTAAPLPSPGSSPPLAESAPESDVVELPVVPAESGPASEVASGDTDPSPEGAWVMALETLPQPQAETSSAAITQAPPVADTVAGTAPSVAEVSPSQNLLDVPELPSTDATDTVIPPRDTPSREMVVAASNPINFGQPLPGATGKAVNAPTEPDVAPPANQEVAPDILIAAGTVLELRYPGNEPLVLEPGTNLNEVMLLENEIRDPITQGVLAPRGSQLIGQFQPNGTNQQWVSQMIIVPAGQRVPLASTSETLIGSPQVDGGRLAAGTGAGALALALLTGFSGIGLIGGAIVGATTMVGTSPQQVVIEPNQIIAVQVMENVPRAMPIAAGPDLSREWGTRE